MISVIIPVYNTKASDLESCIGSIFGQDYTDFEVIIVNDGSTDIECLAALQRLSARYGKIRLINQENGGPSSARNTALDLSTGDFICFVDSDDIILPGFFKEAMSAFDPETSAVFGKTEWVNEDGSLVKTNMSENNASVSDYVFHNDGERTEFIRTASKWKNKEEFKLGIQSELWCKIFRNSVIENVRFNGGVPIGEDQIFTTQTFLRSGKIRIIDRLWYRYIIHPQSLMRSLSVGSVDKYLRFFKGFSEIFGEGDSVVLYEKAYFCFRELLETFGNTETSEREKAFEKINSFTADPTVKKYLFKIPLKATAVPLYDRILCRFGTFKSIIEFKRMQIH